MRHVYDSLHTGRQIQELRFPEGLSVEYKENLRSSRSLAKDCCAFANTNGGLLVIGVKDPPSEGMAPRDFPGVEPVPDPVEQIDGILANSITPRVAYESKPLNFSDHEGDMRLYVLVYVQPSALLHQVSLDDLGTFYRRAGRNSVPMSPLEIQQRIEAVVRHRDNLVKGAEQDIVWPEGRGAGAVTVVPAAPFAVYGLDPAEQQFRDEIEERMRRLTGEAVWPDGRGCASVARVPDHNLQVGVSRNGVCQMIDTRLVNGPLAYTSRDSVYSATAPVTVRPWMSGAGEQIPAWAVYGPYLGRQLKGFFSICSQAYTLMHYQGPLLIRVVLKPAAPHHLVLDEAYMAGGYMRLLPLSRQAQMLTPETDSTVTELESKGNEVARRLVTRVFHSFGLDALAEHTERELRAP